MPASYTLTKITWSSPPEVAQIITVAYKIATDPDSSYITVSNTVQVGVDGTLTVPLLITPLDYSQTYAIRSSNNCGGETYVQQIITPPNPCPHIVGITGTVSAG